MRFVLAVLLAAVCFSTTGTSRALADLPTSPVSVGLARIVIGGALLAALMTLAGRRRVAAAEVVATAPNGGLLRRLPTAAVVAGGAIGVLAYQPTFFAGTGSNGVAVGTVVALGTAPVITGALDAALRARLPQRRWFVATGIALLGLTLVSGLAGTAVDSGSTHAATGGVHPAIVWSVLAGTSYAVYAVCVKELLDRGSDTVRAVGTVFGTAAAVALPLLAATRPTWLFTGRGAALGLWLGVVTIAVAYLLFAYGLGRLPATTVATLTLAEPVGATLLGVGVLDEDLTPAAVVGVAVLVVAVVVLTVRRRRRGVIGAAAAA